MNDAGRMCGFERVANLCGHAQSLRNLERPPCDPLFERLSIQQFDSDEVQSLSFANLVNGADVRMVERRCSLGLTFERLQGLQAGREKLRGQLGDDVKPDALVRSIVS